MKLQSIIPLTTSFFVLSAVTSASAEGIRGTTNSNVATPSQLGEGSSLETPSDLDPTQQQVVTVFSSQPTTTTSTPSNTIHDDSSAAHSSDELRDLAELPDFCWRTSYGRGVGTVPDTCPVGREKIGALCYSRCPAGYVRRGVDCHQICPGSMADQGLFCRLNEYGRGGGYPWQFGDPLSNAGMMSRCERDNGGPGKCEMWGAVAYPKCRAGYYAFGCCLCRPNPPNCAALGLGGQLDLSCAKKIIIGDPVPMGCSSSQQMDAGLCYRTCNKGFTGVGPVCWGQSPTGMVDCGMGAAKDSLTCADVTSNQILAVGELAMFIGTMGASSTGKIATNSAKYAELLAKYKKLVETYKKAKEQYSDVIKTVETAQTIVSAAGTTVSVAQMETLSDPVDMIRMAAEIASLLDPTGISSIVAAYSYPMCNTII